MAHSKLSPSSSARWSVCTASIAAIDANAALLPKQDWSFAEEGTRAHDTAKAILTHSLGQVADNPEMDAHVDAYVKWVLSQQAPGDRILIEKKVRLYYLPDERGTVDAALINRRRIFIGDLKYGQGVSVTAYQNTQLSIYGESLIRELELVEEIADLTPVTLAIFQPRDRNDSNAVREWSLTRAELREFTQRISDAADRIKAGVTELKAGPHCDKSFCPMRGLCTAYAAQGLLAISDAPVDVAIKEMPQSSPPVLTREQRQKVLAAKSAMISWLEEVEKQEMAELLNGAPVLQFKLVEGKSNRQWVDTDQAAKLLLEFLPHNSIYPPVPPEIVSPAQAEKLLKGVVQSENQKAALKAVITKPQGKATLVPITDKRPALLLNPSEGLKALPEPSSLI